jgi:hypothetical protein
MLIGKDRRINDFGGAWSVYGLRDLRVGDDPEERLPVSMGLLPLTRHPLILPMVEMAEGVVADVHLVPGPDADAVLLLDATGDADLHQRMQQAALESRLKGDAPGSDFLDVLPALGMLALVPNGPRTFSGQGRLPPWASGLVPGNDPFTLTEVFPFLDSFLPEAAEVWTADVDRVARTGPWMETSPNGQSLWFEAWALTTGNRRRPVLVLRALGEDHEARQKLIQTAREHALAHDHLLREVEKKEILLHCLAHDLREPLTSLTSSLWMLASGKLSREDAARTVEVGLQQSRRQESLIATLLDLFSPDLGEEKGSLQANLLACAEHEVEVLRSSWESKRLRIQLRVGADARDRYRVRADGNRIGRVLANLLDNAARHAPREGLVMMSVERRQDRVWASVENEGMTIPESHRSRLFQPIEGVARPGRRPALGLLYCRITVEKFKGAITYEPRREGGSRFAFWLRAVIDPVA